MNIILLGAPGAGKGTVAEGLASRHGFTAISTGDIFRKAIKEESELGKKVKAIVESGALVPNELTIALVEERLSLKDWKKGFILDGFPRTLVQAQALYDWTKNSQNPQIDMVVNFVAPKEELEKRLSGRWVCRNCGTTFHKEFKPPKIEGVCDKCSGELFQREDDKLESVKKRLAIYDEQTAPLIEFYRDKGMLRDLRADDKPEAVFKSMVYLLGLGGL